jgi:hypothetical protein
MRLLVISTLLLLATTACDKKGEAPAAPAPAAEPPKPAEAKPAETAAPAAAEAPAEKEVELVDTDLSTADPVWKGWTAKGPKDAKVMQDGVKGARIAQSGMDGLDVIFDQKKQDLKLLKKNLEIGAKNSNGETKHTFSKEEADELAWTTESYGSKSFNFQRNTKVAGKDVTCGGNPMMGFRSEAQVETARKICDSLAKGK